MKRLILSAAIALGLSAPMAYAETPLHEVTDSGMTCEQLLTFDYGNAMDNDIATGTAMLNEYASKGCSPDAFAATLESTRIDACLGAIMFTMAIEELLATEGALTPQETVEAGELINFIAAMSNALDCNAFF